MRASTFTALSAAATGAVASPHYAMYFDEWHKANLPSKDVTAGVTHVIQSFAKSTIFNTGEAYTPFMPIDQIRALFDEGTKVCLAIGGWGDTEGFSAGAATEASRKTFADNVAKVANDLGYDCIDIDWEYPGGNGDDYRETPNDKKVQEIEQYPLLLTAIKEALGDKELSIAAPGREVDMIAYTAEQVPKINEIVDRVNVMTYDLINRRDTKSGHHSGVAGSAKSIDLYLERGMSAEKMSLGFPFYAKWFTTKPGVKCTQPIGCEFAELEAANGTDTGLSSAVTFEVASYESEPDFVNAIKNGQYDAEGGGQWYWDEAKSVFWTWDSVQTIQRKFDEIVKVKKLGGVFAWSLAQDSKDWTHFTALRKGVEGMSSDNKGKSKKACAFKA